MPCANCTTADTEVCEVGGCLDGFYYLGGDCQKCSADCKTCSGNYSTCTDCTLEYYLDSGMCLPCTYPCITCKTLTLCYTCGYDTEFRNPVPSCNCKEEFYDSG